MLRQDDVTFANLETPLSERVPIETGEPPILGAPGAVADALAGVGLDVVSVANNHSYDQTAAGLGETLDALGRVQVRAVGAADDHDAAPGPFITVHNDVRFAFLAYTERINRGPVASGQYVRAARFELEEVLDHVRRVRPQVDVLVLSIHWSHDFVRAPTAAQRERARALIDAGVDVILGHGAHVLQTVERTTSARGDALVAYSLGNLISNQGMRYFAGRTVPSPDVMHPAVVMPETRDGVWLRVAFALPADEATLQIERVEGVPLWTRNNYRAVARREASVLEVRAGPLSSAGPELIAERAPSIAAALGDAVTLVASPSSSE